MYTAEAVDEDSLHSPASVPVQVNIHAVKERAAISTLQAVYDNTSKTIQLNWQYEAEGDYFFIIYRAAGDEPLQRLQSVNKDSKKCNDINTVSGKKYSYAIQAIFRDDNGNTKLSGMVSVERK
jgi:hypothetical protein